MHKLSCQRLAWTRLRCFAFVSLLSIYHLNLDGTAAAVEKTLLLKDLVRLGRPLSPDGKYRLQFSNESYSLHNRYGYFAIHQVKSEKGSTSSHVILRKNIYFMGSNSFVWVPRRPHTLVFCTKLPKGKPYIGLWNGGKSVHILRLGNLPPKTDPDSEAFYIDAISADGRTLFYRHYDMTTRAKEKYAERRAQIKHRLRLPLPAQ